MSLCLGIGAFGLLTALVEGPHRSPWYESDHGEVWKEMVFIEEDDWTWWEPPLKEMICVGWNTTEINELVIRRLVAKPKRGASYKEMVEDPSKAAQWVEHRQPRGFLFVDGSLGWRIGEGSHTGGFIELKVGKRGSRFCTAGGQGS